jgi:hypothetical protein
LCEGIQAHVSVVAFPLQALPYVRGLTQRTISIAETTQYVTHEAIFQASMSLIPTTPTRILLKMNMIVQ